MALFELLKNDKYDDFKKAIMNLDVHNLNVRDESNNYLITHAIIRNRIDIIQLLLDKGCRIDILDQEGKSILYLPIKYGYDEIVKLLLKYDDKLIGVRLVDVKDVSFNTPLHYAIYLKNIFALNLLLQHNSNTNTIDKHGYNSLHAAVN